MSTSTKSFDNALSNYTSESSSTPSRLYLIPSLPSCDSSTTTRYVFTPRTTVAPTTTRPKRTPRLSSYARESHSSAPSTIDPPNRIPFVPQPLFAIISSSHQSTMPSVTHHSKTLSGPSLTNRPNTCSTLRVMANGEQGEDFGYAPPLALSQIDGVFAQSFSEHEESIRI